MVNLKPRILKQELRMPASGLTNLYLKLAQESQCVKIKLYCFEMLGIKLGTILHLNYLCLQG